MATLYVLYPPPDLFDFIGLLMLFLLFFAIEEENLQHSKDANSMENDCRKR